MKIVKPKVEEIKDFEGVDNFYHTVARAARICYASDKTTEDKELVERLIKSKHFSPFEHAIIYVKLGDLNKFKKNINKSTTDYLSNYPKECIKYIVDKYNEEEKCYELAINGRVLIETALCHSDYPMQTLEGTLEVMKKYEIDRHWFRSFIVDTSIGCTREMNRHHDNFCICEQSTRYCNFSKDKFGGEISVNEPYWFDNEEYYNKMFSYWDYSIQVAEKQYLDALNAGVPTDIARGILPLDTHTRCIYTATIEEWNHIIQMRYYGTTGKPHEDAKIIAGKILNLIEK